MTLPARSSRACSHQSASRRARVVTGSRRRRAARASRRRRGSRGRRRRGLAASASRSSWSCWRRFSVSSTAPWRSTMPAKRPPAPTAGSWCGSPIRTALPPACSTRSSTGARTRVSAMPASSTTSTEPGGRPPSARASSSSRWSVVDGMPVSSWSFSAATPDGAAPSTGMPRLREDLRRRRWVAVVLPAPARPTTQTTRRGLVATSRTIASCSSERAIRSARSISSSCSVLIDGAPALAAALDERERGALDRRRARRSSSGLAVPGSELRRPARRRRCATRRVGEPADALGGRARSGVPAPRPSRPRGRRTRSASRSDPSGRASGGRSGAAPRGRAPAACARPSSACSSRCAEAVLGGAGAPVLAQLGRGRRAPCARGSRAPRPGRRSSRRRRARVLDDLRAAASRTRGSRARGTCLSSAMPLRGSSHSTPSVRVSSARRCAW